MDIDWAELARMECACGDFPSLRPDQTASIGDERHSLFLCMDYGQVRARRRPCEVMCRIIVQAQSN